MNAPSGLHSSASELLLRWPDGSCTRLSHGRLRAACPCAQCRAARLQGHIEVIPAAVRIQAMVPQGYGLQLVFSDGHQRGIYPWQYLRELDRL